MEILLIFHHLNFQIFDRIWGLIVDQINSKFICYGSNGVAVFTCLQIDVATQFKSRSTPFLIPMHCMAHRINLIVQFFYV